MNRHVIKGRGEHRGKYLCYARMAGLSPDAGYVWLPEQRKAAHWDDPRYSGGTYATGIAEKHNGYWVKLVAPRAIVERVDDLRVFIRSHAAGAPKKRACYWLDGSTDTEGADCDDGTDFCRDCAEAKLREIRKADPKADVRLASSFDSEHDSPPRCDTCDERLSGSLTDHGSDEEIEALTTNCWPAFDHAIGWDELDDAVVNLADDDTRWRRIVKVVDAAIVAEQKAAQEAAALAATSGMPEARSGLLALLAVRQEQKAPEPSFRLWPEFLRFRAIQRRIPYHKRKESRRTRAWEKRLVKEAKRFASFLGLRSYWSGGMFMIGDYYWPFVVESEQYRLWQPKAYQEGRAYMLHPCPSGDPEWPHDRDANPYPKDSEEHQQWDAGYMHEADGSEEETDAA